MPGARVTGWGFRSDLACQVDSTTGLPTAVAYRLEQGEYWEESRAEGGPSFRLVAPFPVTLDLTEPAQG